MSSTSEPAAERACAATVPNGGFLMTKKQKKMLWRILVSAALLAAAALLDLEGPVRLCAFLLPYACLLYTSRCV